jgi:hypothetical protein
MSRRRRIVVWIAAASLAVLVGLALAAAWVMRPASLKRLVEQGLSSQLNLDTSVEDISVQFLPRPRVSGRALTLRVRGRPDIPPFISIRSFWVDVGLVSIMRRHVDTLHVDGLEITVPPRQDGTPAEDAAFAGHKDHGVIVDHLVAHDAKLSFVATRPDRRPLQFHIHALEVDDIGFDRPIPFYARLTNPIPEGIVETRGTFGPWRRDDGTQTALSGEYTFLNANLATINGIGGTLQSTGRYEGELTRIAAYGSTETPDFSLELGGKPVRLSTTFHAVIDGTNGSTELVNVNAKLLNTPIRTRGGITNLAGPGRHDLKLDVTIDAGRIEDILALAIDTPDPMLRGNLSLRSTFALPPGKTKVPRRLAMRGQFGLGAATFTDSQVQAKLQELSRRSQGKDKDEPLLRVLTNLSGQFRIDSGVMTLSRLSFSVPGATVGLAGTYGLDSGAIDFRGTLRMQAGMSDVVGGFKSIFLKPFNPLFRKDGAGTLLPIKITGSREAPRMGIEMGKIFRRGS